MKTPRQILKENLIAGSLGFFAISAFQLAFIYRGEIAAAAHAIFVQLVWTPTVVWATWREVRRAHAGEPPNDSDVRVPLYWCLAIVGPLWLLYNLLR